MLYDASRLDQPDLGCFSRDRWRAQGRLEEISGGRGTVAFLADGTNRWVLRHYRRGGAVARLLDDRYAWMGEARVRSFREFRLLRQLVTWGLPVPVPVAAGYCRAGPVGYRADLITEELPTRLTLAQALREAPVAADTWGHIGASIGRLHAHGVHHADLNANNILLGPAAEVYVVDFDRGRVRRRGRWEDRVLARLERSLRKVTAGLPADRFGAPQWERLMRGLRD